MEQTTMTYGTVLFFAIVWWMCFVGFGAGLFVEVSKNDEVGAGLFGFFSGVGLILGIWFTWMLNKFFVVM